MICSRTESDTLAGLLTDAFRQCCKKFIATLGVKPQSVSPFIVKSARAGRHPDFLQRFLQIDDDLAVAGKCQRDHATRALVVDVGISRVIDAVTGQFNGGHGLLGMVQIVKVGHYNLKMFYLHRIITVTSLACVLSACGQKGPLFLTPQSVPFSLLPSSSAVLPPAAPASSAK